MHLLEKGQGEGLKLSNGNVADIMLGMSYFSTSAKYIALAKAKASWREKVSCGIK